MTRFAFRAAIALILISSSLSSLFASASAHRMFEDDAELHAQMGLTSGSWNSPNDPDTWNTGYNYVLATLPTSGKVEHHMPWSDTYWPSNKAGIAARWNSAGVNGFRYSLLSESQVRAMSKEQLAGLSPAEKYDIFMGRFDYPTVRMVRAGTSPHAEYWSGICHGWAPAALNHAEPAPVTVTSATGIVVPFGSADVKALLANYYANHEEASNFLGLKCQAGEGGNIFRRIASPFLRGPSCDDVNAGALHVILANELGIRHQGFVADVDRWREVWNQPVYEFKSQIIGYQPPLRGAAPGTAQVAVVQTEMYYADEIEPMWNPVVGTPHFKQGIEKYEYMLELDAVGRIIGGQYISANRPDFLWRGGQLEFTGYNAGINQIYRPVGK